MKTWKLDGAKRVQTFVLLIFIFSYIERALAFYWRRASAALLQKVHVQLSIRIKVLIFLTDGSRTKHQRKKDG